MPLDLPDGTACFVDSNILYYALVPTADVSERCIKLLDRAISGLISISVSVPILSDTIHKVMTSEAAQIAGRDRAGIVGFFGKTSGNHCPACGISESDAAIERCPNEHIACRRAITQNRNASCNPTWTAYQ